MGMYLNLYTREGLADLCELKDRRIERLEELVRVLAYCGQPDSDCDECRLNGSCGKVDLDHTWACDGLMDMLTSNGRLFEEVGK